MAEGSKVGVGEELGKVRAAIAAQEGCRGLLPAEQIQTALDFLRAKEAHLLANALVLGDGAIAQAAPGGTAVGVGKGGVGIGRDHYGNITVNPPPEGGAPSAEALERRYLGRLAFEVGAVSLSGIDPALTTNDPRERLRLEAVYTGLRTRTVVPAERELSGQGRDGPASGLGEGRDSLSALEMLDRSPRLVLLGDPGSGKSTFLNFVALCQAGERLGLAEANREVLTAALPGKEEPQPWGHAKRLPLRVILRDFAAEADSATAEDLWQHVEREVTRWSLGEWAPLLRRRLIDGGVLVLFDGLDEVPQARDRRVRICGALESFVASFSSCRFLVTSRTYAYQNQGWRLADFAEAVLAPFDSAQIDLFVSRWYAHLAALGRLDADDAQGRSALLVRAIEGSERLLGLAERPLLLTLMASLHAWRGGSLPERREALYAAAVQLLLDLWERQRYKRDEKGELRLEQPGLAAWLATDQDAVRKVLEDLAFDAHAAQPDLSGTADLDEGRLVKALLRLAKSEEVSQKVLIDYLSQRSGLLVARGEGVYTLPHRSFQEYLAACRLTRTSYPGEVAKLARADPDRWREVLLLAAAKAAGGATSGVWALAERLCFREPNAPEATLEDAWGAHLAGQAVVESGALEDLDEAYEARLGLLRRWHERLIGEERLAPRERALAGETLAALGDLRFDPEHWMLPRGPLLGFVEVPAGAFRMGSDKSLEAQFFGDESPEHRVELPSFYIARWPVTVGQFRAFVAATGYVGVSERALAEGSNRPIRWVSFEDAQAYARWLGEQLRKEASGKGETAGQGFWEGLASGRLRVTLPSEAEWEKAARGDDGRTYPWGEKFDANRGNSYETGIGEPSAVGCFPGGASLYGAEEQSGNVWEWTRSVWGSSYGEADFKYPYVADDGREDLESPSLRVLRGGAFDFEPGYVRCAVRRGLGPGERVDLIGFRVVVSPFPL